MLNFNDRFYWFLWVTALFFHHIVDSCMAFYKSVLQFSFLKAKSNQGLDFGILY